MTPRPGALLLPLALLAALVLAACSGGSEATPTAPALTASPEVAASPSATARPEATTRAPFVLPTPSPTARPPVARSGAWLIDVASGDAILLTARDEDGWVSRASFDADGAAVIDIWRDDGPLTVRVGLDGHELGVDSPAHGCHQIDDDTIAVTLPGLDGPQEFEGVTCGVISPDRRLMTYRIDAGTVQTDRGFEVPSWDQWVIDLSTGERTLLRSAMRHCGGCDTGVPVAWSPSSRYVAVPELLWPGDVFLADTLTGSTRLISEVDDATYRPYQPVWASNTDRLVYPAAGGGTVYEDLEAGTRRVIAGLPWPASFDPSARYLYSPAWPLSGQGASTTVVFDIVSGTTYSSDGVPASGNLWGGTAIAVAGLGPGGAEGFATALESAPNCRGTSITVSRPNDVEVAPVCIDNAWVATLSPDGTQVALARRGTEVGPDARGTWVSGRFDLVVYDLETRVTRVIATELYSSTTPGFTWNEAGTHVLFRWPGVLGL